MKIPKESIQVVAQSLGIDRLDDAIADALAMDVTYRLRQISQDALKFLANSARTRLATEDIDAALSLRNIEVSLSSMTSSKASLRVYGTNASSIQTHQRT